MYRRPSAYLHCPQLLSPFGMPATGPASSRALMSSVVRDLLFDPHNPAPQSRLLFDLVFLVFALLMMQVVRGRNQLELKVAERTVELTRLNDNLRSEIAEHNRVEAELRLSQAYLAEAQRLSHTGSWGIESAAGRHQVLVRGMPIAFKALTRKRGSLDLNH